MNATVRSIDVLTGWPADLADAIAVVEADLAEKAAALRADGEAAHADLSDPRWWARFALCAQTDPELFTATHGPDADAARDICAACPALNECRAYALDVRERWGIWGGLTRADRARVLGEQDDDTQDEQATTEHEHLELAS